MVSVLLRYQELALKGRNRPWFQRILIRNLQRTLAGLSVREIRVPMGRIELVVGDEAAVDEVRERLRYVVGLANFSVVHRVDATLDAIVAGVLDRLPAQQPSSFRVTVRRSDKRFPHPTPDVERIVGQRIVDARGWTVDLSDPALVIGVEIVPGAAYVHLGKEPGAGGLPSGTSGRVMALVSGGIDSPVAAWRLMRRGCTVELVHFHSYPFLSQTSQEKARRLAGILGRYQMGASLHVVPFGEIQRQVTLSVPGPMRVVVYRRLMLRIAEALAARQGARALVTGEVIGQVASQTLENMTAIGSATTMTVFRPLIGMDKEEIIAQAQRLGTYDISVVPDEDCCTLFTPRHPATRATLAEAVAVDRALPMAELVGTALRHAHVERIAWPVLQSPTVAEPSEAPPRTGRHVEPGVAPPRV
jgi:thiamine biosynthesis protein ThiI